MLSFSKIDTHDGRYNLIFRILRAVIFLAFLIALSKIHYIWFHTAVEFSSAAIGITLYIIASSSYHLHKNAFLLFLSQAFFWSGCLDIVHAMVYPGMGLAANNFNPPPQLWIGARALEAIALLLAPLFFKARLRETLSFWLMGGASLAWGGLVFAGWLPEFFIPGTGLTGIKVICEYAIIATLLVAGYRLYRQRSQLPEGIAGLIFGMVLLTIGTELCFTLYFSMYDILNLLGHVLKVLSYGLMLQVVLVTMIDQPFRVMSRNAYSFDAIPLPVLVLDRQGVVRACNENARRARPAGGVGQTLHGAWHASGDTADCPICAAIAAGRSFVGDIGMADRWINVVLRPVSLDDGLAEGFVCVLNDLTERREAELALAKAKTQAETVGTELAQKNKDLERFTQILAHHLQEPARLQGAFAARLQKLLEADQMTPDVAGAVAHIIRGAERLRLLLRDVQRYLALSQTPWSPQSCDTGKALAAALSRLQTKIADTGADIRHGELPPVLLDPDRLTDVFAALIDNGLSYARAGQAPVILVEAEPRGREVVLAIEDNGIGIPEEYQERVFNVFERLDPGCSPLGTGTGLAVVRKIVELANGKVWIETAGSGGTRVVLTLPSGEGGNQIG